MRAKIALPLIVVAGNAVLLLPSIALSALIDGYGKTPFGANMAEVREAMPAADWKCSQNSGFESCTTSNPGIRGIDVMAVALIEGEVVKSMLYTTRTSSNIELLASFEKYRDIFSKKYGKPTVLSEKLMYPYKNTRSEFHKHGSTAVGAGKASYVAIWKEEGPEENHNGAMVKMEKKWISITYESKEWNDYVDARAAEAESEF